MFEGIKCGILLTPSQKNQGRCPWWDTNSQTKWASIQSWHKYSTRKTFKVSKTLKVSNLPYNLIFFIECLYYFLEFCIVRPHSENDPTLRYTRRNQ